MKSRLLTFAPNRPNPSHFKYVMIYVAFRTVCNIFWGKVDFGPFDFGQV